MKRIIVIGMLLVLITILGCEETNKNTSFIDIDWNSNKKEVINKLKKQKLEITSIDENEKKVKIYFSGKLYELDNSRGKITLIENKVEYIDIEITNIPKIIIRKKHENIIFDIYKKYGKPYYSGDPYESGNHTTEWSFKNKKGNTIKSSVNLRAEYIGKSYTGIYSDTSTKKYRYSIEISSSITRKK
jgi:hypothetical protein